ncbi:acyl transferase [Ekhidna sp.]
MNFTEEFKHNLFGINEKNFLDSSLAVFEYQYKTNNIYHSYCKYLNKKPGNVCQLSEIPFMPIEFFKNHTIKCGDWKEEIIFKSSGTTDSGRSKHYIKDISNYHQIAKINFENQIGSLSQFQIVAFLPSYQEQGDSSLISMVDHFMKFSHPSSDYFLHKDIEQVLKNDHKKLVIGVSYALLDIAEKSIPSNNALVMETGGMKGRRKEITRSELHKQLKEGLGVTEIWSEYGMTELQSQAYGKDGVFTFPNWSKCLIRDINDPFSYLPENRTGGINIIDLANVETCSFIETKDLGRSFNGCFEVLGRFDNSDIRGCNLLI